MAAGEVQRRAARATSRSGSGVHCRRTRFTEGGTGSSLDDLSYFFWSYFLWNFSMRPAVSMSFCFPVKNG